MRLLFAILVGALPLSAASADDCANPTSQMTMNLCAGEDARKADAALNAVYRQLMERAQGDNEITKLLVATERAWLAFRDAECAFAASRSVEGSIYPMLVVLCRAGLTSARVDELKAYLECEEGSELLCPLPAR